MAPDDPMRHVRAFRRLFLVSVTASAALLIPWIVYLAVTLRSRHRTDHWDLAWVGFDIALLLALGATSVAAMQRRQLVIPAAVVSATLLLTDSWFDIVLDWGHRGVWYSIFSACAFEIPLAILLFVAAGRVLHAMLNSAWRAAGRTGRPPKLREVRIADLVEIMATPRPQHEQEQVVLTDS